jgi:hypothetical protein
MFIPTPRRIFKIQKVSVLTIDSKPASLESRPPFQAPLVPPPSDPHLNVIVVIPLLNLRRGAAQPMLVSCKRRFAFRLDF